MSRRAVLVLLPLTAALAAPGCGYDPSDPFTQVPPVRGAVVGSWTLDEAGSEPLRAGGRFRGVPALILKADGTFVARGVPDWWSYSERVVAVGDEAGNRWVPTSGSGRWSLEKSQNAWVVQLDFRDLRSKPRGLVVRAYLYGQKPPYQLGAIVGDPDEGRVLIFRKGDPGGRCRGHRAGI